MAAPELFTVTLTADEMAALRACVAGELDNDDGLSSDYMDPLRGVTRKLAEARSGGRSAERDAAIRQAYAEGVPSASIAEAYGLTRQRVWQIVWRANA